MKLKPQDIQAARRHLRAVEQLTQVKGIGRWTAEMFLISALGRPDVFPYDDLGVRTAIRNRYGLADLDDFDLVVAVKEAEHRPLMMEQFPLWAEKVEYWHVDDLDCALPDEAIPCLEEKVRGLVNRLAADVNVVQDSQHSGNSHEM